MRNILNQCAPLLRRFSALNQNDPSAEVQPPVVMACLVCFISVVWLARPVVRLVGIGWIGLLIYALIPIAASFVILYRRYWHQEITGLARIRSMVLWSSAIFGIVSFSVGLMVAILCFFAIAFGTIPVS